MIYWFLAKIKESFLKRVHENYFFPSVNMEGNEVENEFENESDLQGVVSEERRDLILGLREKIQFQLEVGFALGFFSKGRYIFLYRGEPINVFTRSQ